MKLDVKEITASLAAFAQILRRYILVIAGIAVVGAYVFLLWRINTLAGQSPTEEAVNEKLQGLTLPKIDQNAITKIQQLQDNSVDVRSLFQQARDNPFQE